jgi:outer membrane receptor protein involved in Fe transport
MVNSVLPDGELGGRFDFTYGNYNLLQTEGALSLPLIDGVLSARLAFTANFRDGITENKCADWDPVANGFSLDTLAQEGIDPVISRESTEAVYDRLEPHPGIDTGTTDPQGRPVYRGPEVRQRTVRGNGRVVFPPGSNRQNFVYLNVDLARRLTQDNIAGITWGNDAEAVDPFTNRWELNEPLDHDLDPNTAPLPVGTPIALQNSVFQISDSAADGVCIVRAPGTVVTPAGQNFINAQGELAPFGTAGAFDKASGVSSLSDFQGLKHNLNDIGNWAARGILKYDPIPDMQWILNLHGGQNRSDSRHLQMLGAEGEGTKIKFEESLENGFSEANAARIMQQRNGFEGTRSVEGLDASANGSFPGEGGADSLKGFYNRDGGEFLDAAGFSLRGQWDLRSVALTWLTGGEWYDRFVEDEGDANPIDSFPAEWMDTAWQVSQELRADGEGERFSWRVGGFFLYEKLDAFNVFPDTRELRIEQTFDQALWSLAPYVGGSYFFTETVSLEGGLRYNVEHKDFALGTDAIGTTSGIAFDEIPEQTDSRTWTGLTGDVTLTWSPVGSWLDAIRADDLSFYGKYAHGMKGGHFNAGLTIRGEAGVVPRVEPVEPEFIDSLEFGLKSRWFDDRVILNSAIFGYLYKDLQVFDIVNEAGELPLQQLLNGDARVLGVEVEFQARPLPGLFMQAGFGWLHTEFVDLEVTKTVISGGPGGGSSTSANFDYAGNPLIAAPDYNLSGIVEYAIPLSRFGTIVPQYDFSFRSKVYLDPQHADPISQDPYWLHNARLAYRTPNDRIEVAAWVRNFLDERYKVDVFDVSRDFNTILEVWGDPRTFGLTITLGF